MHHFLDQKEQFFSPVLSGGWLFYLLVPFELLTSYSCCRFLPASPPQAQRGHCPIWSSATSLYLGDRGPKIPDIGMAPLIEFADSYSQSMSIIRCWVSQFWFDHARYLCPTDHAWNAQKKNDSIGYSQAKFWGNWFWLTAICHIWPQPLQTFLIRFQHGLPNVTMRPACVVASSAPREAETLAKMAQGRISWVPQPQSF